MHSGATFVSGGLILPERRSLQVQVHQKRAKDQIQGCTEAGDQTQTPVLPREDDICDDGERVPVQGAGVLSSSQTSEHQESGQMVPHLEGQAQGVRSLSLGYPVHMDQARQKKDDNTTRTVFVKYNM